MQIDLSSLIVAITGIAALIWGVIQSNRSRRDTREQQTVANELARRERDWEELRDERDNTRRLRTENDTLHAQLRVRDDLAVTHRTWDRKAQIENPDLPPPPPLHPNPF